MHPHWEEKQEASLLLQRIETLAYLGDAYSHLLSPTHLLSSSFLDDTYSNTSMMTVSLIEATE